MYMLTDTERVQYGVATCAAWSKHLDDFVKQALSPLVQKDSVVAAMGGYGYGDDCSLEQRPLLLICSEPSHAAIIMDQITSALPLAIFHVDCPLPSMRAELHTARVVWGHGELPPAPIGDTFAREWAPVAQASLDSSDAIACWRTARTLCAIGSVSMPPLLDLPQAITDLYTARNMGLKPSHMQLAHMVNDSLAAIVEGLPVASVARHLRTLALSLNVVPIG